MLFLGCASGQKKSPEELARLIQQRMEEADRLYQQGDYEGALRVRKALLQEYPNHPLVNNHYFYLWLGDCYMALKRYVEAWDSYSEAAKIALAGLEDVRRRIASAQSVREAKRWRKLADERLRPGLSAAHRRLARVLAAKKEWDAALRQLELALDICPEDVKALYLRARFLEEAGRDARGAWRGFLEAVKRTPEVDLAAYGIGDREISEAQTRLGGSPR